LPHSLHAPLNGVQRPPELLKARSSLAHRQAVESGLVPRFREHCIRYERLILAERVVSSILLATVPYSFRCNQASPQFESQGGKFCSVTMPDCRFKLGLMQHAVFRFNLFKQLEANSLQERNPRWIPVSIGEDPL
jgi:hypothetical protein